MPELKNENNENPTREECLENIYHMWRIIQLRLPVTQKVSLEDFMLLIFNLTFFPESPLEFLKIMEEYLLQFKRSFTNMVSQFYIGTPFEIRCKRCNGTQVLLVNAETNLVFCYTCLNSKFKTRMVPGLVVRTSNREHEYIVDRKHSKNK